MCDRLDVHTGGSQAVGRAPLVGRKGIAASWNSLLRSELHAGLPTAHMDARPIKRPCWLRRVQQALAPPHGRHAAIG
ncbi:hypothetical protein EYF80_013602 [Liparis tanakae]|uniref:Uncharacterized protein n=1 Tax=Liparis tanakae TaxID=230148 RepID=A0A4Z2IE84_9TELE|nr:hypothetical protein EYF80_013602 [Liparis tanakae]